MFLECYARIEDVNIRRVLPSILSGISFSGWTGGFYGEHSRVPELVLERRLDAVADYIVFYNLGQMYRLGIKETATSSSASR